jgi:hypothetical protein
MDRRLLSGGFFTKKKINKEERYHERASMTSQRKEKILWLACRIASLGTWLIYDGKRLSVPSNDEDDDVVPSRVSTFASIATSGNFRTGTLESQDGETLGVEKDMSSPSTVKYWE